MWVLLAFALATPAIGVAQDGFPEGSPLTRLPVYDTPFSAEAVTAVNLRLPDGARLTRRTTARYYRDNAGRVRIEHLMEGLPEARTLLERHVRLMLVPNPCEGAITLDPASRTFRHGPKDVFALTSGAAFTIPAGGVSFHQVPRPLDIVRGYGQPPPGTLIDEETLGTRHLEGLEVFGYRITTTTLPGQVGNNREITVTDEWWYSPDLRLVMAADYVSSEFGTFSYRVTGLRREEQPDSLFTVPEGYVVDLSGSPQEPSMRFMPTSLPRRP